MKDMFRRNTLGGSFAVMCMTLAQSATAEEVRVYNWDLYIDESLLEKFQEETGINLVYDVFESNETLETKLLAGSAGYDVVAPSASFLERQIQAGVFQPLDMSKLPNAESLWDAIRSRTANFPGVNEHSVTYMWGTTGIGLNVPRVREVLGDDAPLDSWELVFNPEYMEKLSDCGVYFLDAPASILPAVANYIGEDPNAQDIETIEKALPVMEAIRPYIRKFNSSEYVSALANGDACAAVGWSGDIFQARDRADEAENGVEITYVVPKEGADMWFDQFAIPVDAPNPDAAHAFINFILAPENIAQATNFIWYANAVDASIPLLDPEISGDPEIYPDKATMDGMYTVAPWGHKTQRAVTRMWTKIKSGT